MLTDEEFVEAFSHVLGRQRWYHVEIGGGSDERGDRLESPERAQAAMDGMCSELGVPTGYVLAAVDYICENYMGLSQDFILRHAPQQLRSLVFAIWVGVECGKRVERITHTTPDEQKEGL